MTTFHRTIRGRAATSLIAACAALAAAAFAVTSANGATTTTFTQSEIKRMVIQEALNSSVPPSLALALAKVESDFRAGALSSKGARGVMQIMPATARGEYGIGTEELWDARLNIQLGIDFLERLIDRYNGRWDLALSHYNGGSIAGSLPDASVLPVTKRYVEAVLRWERRYAEQAAVWQLAEADDEGWRPARTHVEWVDADDAVARRTEGRVRWSEPESLVRWTPADDRVWVRVARLRPAAFEGTLDDFSDDLEQRRLELRAGLDDFASIVTWTDG